MPFSFWEAPLTNYCMCMNITYITDATSQWSFALSACFFICWFLWTDFLVLLGAFRQNSPHSLWQIPWNQKWYILLLKMSASKSQKRIAYWPSKAKHVWALCGSNNGFKPSIYFPEKGKKNAALKISWLPLNFTNTIWGERRILGFISFLQSLVVDVWFLNWEGRGGGRKIRKKQ